MAQSKSFFGNRRGSTKSHTYQVNGGLQITKDRVDEVKNPRTSAQMVHRCCLHTLSDAHAYLRPIVENLWEGVMSPSATLAAFRKANYPILRAAAESNNTDFSFSPFKQTTWPIGLFKVGDGLSKLSVPSVYMSRGQTNRVGAGLSSISNTYASFKKWCEDWDLQVNDVIHVAFICFVQPGQRPFVCIQNFQLLAIPDVPATELTVNQVYKCSYWQSGQASRVELYWDRNPRFYYYMPFEMPASKTYYMCKSRSRVVNGKKTFTPAVLSAQTRGPIVNTFPEAIATYPQGGGNVLDGGTI